LPSLRDECPTRGRRIRDRGDDRPRPAARAGAEALIVGAPSRLLVSAAHKSSGKTTVAIGLAAALARRRLVVQPFKKGPDFIDPLWLSAAAGRRCRNLDPYLSSDEEIRATFRQHAAGADVAIVEGNKGLHDGVAVDGSNSNAALAKLLDLPVVLVIDSRGMTRGVAPLVLGYQAFDRDVRIAGVILNRVGGARHEAKLRMVLEHYTDVPVLGAVHHDERLGIAERHLGLVPSNESTQAQQVIADLATAIERQVDVDRLLRVSAAPGATRSPAPAVSANGAESTAPADIRIGVAQDRAFGFYYPEDLEALRAAGATLVRFDALADAQLPNVDALFIGGGFPEMHARELEANAALRTRLRNLIDAGLPVYAECGGLMYLARSISVGGQTYRMVGAIPGDAVMRDRPVGRGYVHLEETEAFPWPAAPGTSGELRAHEFHHASLENLPADARFAYRVRRGHGIDGARDGIVVGNVLGSFAHLRSTGGRDWPARFVEFIRASGYRRRREGNIVWLSPPRPREAAVL
jgi:cobyrinic acid a,c-diamide synthase